MAYTFDKANADAPSTRHTQYFEMMGVQGLYDNGWMLSAVPIRAPWELLGAAVLDPSTAYRFELYDLRNDWTQFQDVSAANPKRSRKWSIRCSPSSASIRCCHSTRRWRHVLLRQGLPWRRPEQSSTIPNRSRFRRARNQAPQHLLHHHRRHRGSQGRRGRHDCDLWREVWRIRFLSLEGKACFHH